MSTVVQATCPGCKNVLRIPSGWLQQSVKCKHCGMVLQARPAAAAPRKPAPARPAAPAPVRSAAPAQVPSPAPLAPPPLPAPPAAYPASVPVAAPVAVAVPVDAGSPFGVLDQAEDDAPARRRKRRKQGGGWKGPVVLLLVLAVAGGLTAAFWPSIQKLLEPDKQVAEKEGKKEADKGTKPEKKAPNKYDDDGDEPPPAKKENPKSKKDRADKGKHPARDPRASPWYRWMNRSTPLP